MVNVATLVFYNQDQEMEAKAQEKERRKEARHVQIVAALYGQPQSKGTLLPMMKDSTKCHLLPTWTLGKGVSQ